MSLLLPTFFWYATLKKTVSVKERQMSHTLAKRYEGLSGFEMYFLLDNEINDTLGFTSCCWQSRVCRRRCQASRFIFVAPSRRACRQYQHCVVFLVSGFTLICVASPRRGVATRRLRPRNHNRAARVPCWAAPLSAGSPSICPSRLTSGRRNICSPRKW